MEKLTVLVVGGTGFLGQHVVAELAERGHRATVLSRRPGPGDGALAGDARQLSEEQWADLLAGYDGVVFAAGTDDRTVPKAPAEAYFRAGNVEPVRRLMAAARRAGCTAAVVHGSCFAALHRLRPELQLTRHHPYIRSRVEQAAAAREAAGAELPVAVLEIPYVFGAAPGRRPLWAPAVPWLGSRFPLIAPPGGTAVVTARTVARATVRALELRSGADHPVVDENLTWDQLLTRFAAAAGRTGPIRTHPLPRPLLVAALRGTGVLHRLRGRESGLAPDRLAILLTAELFLDTGAVRALGLEPDDVDAAFRATVAASR